MEIAAWTKYLGAAIPFLTFFLTCAALAKRKVSARIALAAAGGCLAAVTALQIGLALSGQDADLILTLLPLTAYLPTVLVLHLLSAGGFFETCSVWLAGALAAFTLEFLKKLLWKLLSVVSGPSAGLIFTAVLLLVAALLLLVVFRRIKNPFRDYIAEYEGGWLPFLFPVLMVMALLSYFSDSATNVIALLLVFLTALSVVLALAQLLKISVSLRQAKEMERAVSRQLEVQHRDYKTLQEKLDMGRAYRHDMRHHLTALNGLLRQGEQDDARQYVESWFGQLSETEGETWCANAAVNAVLSTHIAQAREAGCTVDADVQLSDQLPVHELDLCAVLANALENAVNACRAVPERDRRQLRLAARLNDGRLTIQVENSCAQDVAFDRDGFPIVPRREGHGIGLHSIAAVVKKYQGIFQCTCREGRFTLSLILFAGSEEEPLTQAQPRHMARTALAGVLLGCFLLNCMPMMAQALEQLPVVGNAVRVIDLRSYTLRWGDTGISVTQPGAAGGAGAEEIDQSSQVFIEQMRETFTWYVMRKYEGYVSMEADYTVVRDDGALLVLRFYATVNVGGSVDCSRYITLDKTSGQVLELADLFQPEANYVWLISREITAQMEEQMNAGEASYFLPGGIWPEEECFQSIDPDQNFYINEENQLIIVFDEYQVAPGSMGMPEFAIPAEVLSGLLAQPSIL